MSTPVSPRLYRCDARATDSAFQSVGFSLDAKPPVKWGGNGGAGNSFTIKAPRHQESSGGYCLTNGVTWCLGVLVVQLVFTFNAPATGTAFPFAGFTLNAKPPVNGGGNGGARLWPNGHPPLRSADFPPRRPLQQPSRPQKAERRSALQRAPNPCPLPIAFQNPDFGPRTRPSPSGLDKYLTHRGATNSMN